MNDSGYTLDLGVVSNTEIKLLKIALGVLRSATDYADFLNSWLCDYGCQILSPNPPPGLLQDVIDADMSKEEFTNLPWFGQTSLMVN
jgi:hypothetical protein